MAVTPLSILSTGLIMDLLFPKMKLKGAQALIVSKKKLHMFHQKLKLWHWSGCRQIVRRKLLTCVMSMDLLVSVLGSIQMELRTLIGMVIEIQERINFSLVLGSIL